MKGFYCIIRFFLVGLIIHASNGGKYEKKLLKLLFDPTRKDAHNPQERPIKDDKKPLEVRLKISLIQIIDVDEKNQILKTTLWLDEFWYDYHFQWDPLEFGNITLINVDPSKVWKPDLLMYNSANEMFDSAFPTNVVISHTGLMHFVPPGMFSSTCTIDITYFPFDRQDCFIKFGSWTYDGNGIDLKLQCIEDNGTQTMTGACTSDGKADLTSYVKSGEWTLYKSNVIQNVDRYDCCDVNYYDIKLKLQMQRRSLYYIFNLIIPCALVSIIALLVFTLPPDAGEKIGLGVTILLSQTMILLLVADNMPQTSVAIPLIGTYFSVIMILCSASVVCTIGVLNYHHRSHDAEEVPKFIKIFVNTWMAKMLFMKHPVAPPEEEKSTEETNFPHVGALEIDPAIYGPTGSKSAAASKKRVASRLDLEFPVATATNNGAHAGNTCLYDVGMQERSSKSLLANVLDLDDDFRVLSTRWNGVAPPSYFNCVGGQASNKRRVGESSTSGAAPTPPPNPTPTFCTTRHELESILTELRFVTQKIKDDEADSIIGKEWKFAARVIDRFCLWFYAAFTLVSTFGILLSAETMHDGVIPVENTLN